MASTKKSFSQTLLTVAVAGAVAFGAFGAAGPLLAPSVHAAQNVTAEQQKMALETLNSFYKPALNGHFPGPNIAGKFIVGKTTRQTVLKELGKPGTSRKTASGFDIYEANMGNPGYALSYSSSNVLLEIRYFGTNVERQTNIGGITISMLKKNWYAPSSTSTISGTKQTKLTYIRGSYKLEFIFDSPTRLNHINLTKK